MSRAEDVRAVLENLADHVIVAQYEDASERVATLETALAAYATSLSAADRAAAREAFTAAMMSWERAELYQVGPTGSAFAVRGGLDLRDGIYAWPLTSRCRIDQETAGDSYASSELLANEAVNVRGLDTIEYLLFIDEPGNGCAATTDINALGTWTMLGDAEIARRRAVYAHSAATLVRGTIERAVTAWSSTGGNFRAQLVGAGTTSTTYTTAQSGLNAVSDGLFYIYRESTDVKLAQPAGLMMCTADTCPDTLELPFSNLSRDAIIANLEGFRAAYLGGEPGADGQGFDDLLVALGQTDLDQRMRAAIETALTAVRALPTSLRMALETNLTDVRAAYTAMNDLGRLLKTEFVTVLDLELPMRIEGDND